MIEVIEDVIDVLDAIATYECLFSIDIVMNKEELI